jgi:hypothetical protein
VPGLIFVDDAKRDPAPPTSRIVEIKTEPAALLSATGLSQRCRLRRRGAERRSKVIAVRLGLVEVVAT